MPKRKREDTEQDVDRIKNQAIRIKASRLKARFDQGVVQLTQALKLARGFDRQKMTRRITQAGSDQSKLDRLKAEVKVLNELQEARVARRYLLKQCARTKRISEAEGFVALFGGSEKVLATIKKDGAVELVEGNVLGRLMKSGPVSDVVPGVMKGIREVLGVDREKPPNGTTENSGSHGSNGVTPANQVENPSQEEEFVGFSDDLTDEKVPAITDENQDVAMGESEMLEDLDDDLLEAYNDRLAASSDSESASDDIPDIQGQNHDRLDDMELTDEEPSDQDDILSVSDSEHDQPAQKSTTKNPPTISGTSFLPTLMHGGYYSGSDSASDVDPSDLNYDPDKSFAAMTKPVRKNRRGQQERRAIAEKKFGSNAKHLVKANGAEGVHSARQRLINGDAVKRDQGWDARKGAVGGHERKSRDAKSEGRPLNRYERRHGVAKPRPTGGAVRSRGAFAGAVGRSTGANSTAVTGARPIAAIEKKPAKPTASKEKLHPSWEAARKRKIESATIGASSFAGKKITFD